MPSSSCSNHEPKKQFSKSNHIGLWFERATKKCIEYSIRENFLNTCPVLFCPGKQLKIYGSCKTKNEILLSETLHMYGTFFLANTLKHMMWNYGFYLDHEIYKKKLKTKPPRISKFVLYNDRGMNHVQKVCIFNLYVRAESLEEKWLLFWSA